MRRLFETLFTILGLAALLAFGTSPALAQDNENAGETAEQPQAEIIVKGLRLREGEDLPAEVRQSGESRVVSRQISSDAARFFRCAGLPRPSLLRRIVDGRPETAETTKALHSHIMRNSGCFSGIPNVPPYPQTPYYGQCNPILLPNRETICRAPFDRGEIYEKVLQEYAPDLILDRSMTFDPAIRSAFMRREERRNAARKGDGDFFWLLTCMVQIRPEYALALLQEQPGSSRESRLRTLMVADGLPCIEGEVKNVQVDGGQFRAFLAEAVYSWAVAVRGADSLLPSDSLTSGH